MAGDYFLGKKNFFDSKNDAFYTKNGAFLHLLLVCTIFFVYIFYTLFVRVPVRFSDCSLGYVRGHGYQVIREKLHSS